MKKDQNWDVYIHKVILVVMILLSAAVNSYSRLQEIYLFYLQLDFKRKGRSLISTLFGHTYRLIFSSTAYSKNQDNFC